MIIAMKKVSLLCLHDERIEALQKLRKLGVMHVNITSLPETKDRSKLQQLYSNVLRSVDILAARKNNSKNEVKKTEKEWTSQDLFARIDHLQKENEKLVKDLDATNRAIATMQIWGDFSPDLLEELAKQQINVHFCEAPQKAFSKLAENPKLTIEQITVLKGKVYFVVFAQDDQDVVELPLAVLPKERSLSRLKDHRSKLLRYEKEINAELDGLFCHVDKLEHYAKQIRTELDFLVVRDGMAQHEELASIQGFIPDYEANNLINEAEKSGWGLLLEEPDESDNVPTLIKIPKLFRFIQPLFEFLGISPGYNEIDVSLGVLFFFVIYFGMIVGDAGYGAIFLLVTLLFKFKLKGKEKFVLPLRLMTVLSCATLLWGGLSGNWFGLSAPGIEWLSGVNKDRNVQFFCFLLAVMQLSLGHFWKAVLSGKLRKIAGQLGWALLLWGNFFLTIELVVDRTGIFPEYMFWLYGIGLVLIVLCDVNWKNPSEAFNFPFSLISSFVDMLSYIRLFAVGMAGFYIASSFNGMFQSMLESSSGAMVIVAVALGLVVILFGHLLNIALCMMGVLVHGVRLNTLEFSNHIGLTWSGIKFKPFKNELKEK